MKLLSIIAFIFIIAALHVMATSEKTLLSLSLFVFAFCCVGVICAMYENKSNNFYKNVNIIKKDIGLISARDI